MASLIEDLIRGTADATAQMADDNIKFNRQKELMNQQMANQKSLADYNAEISQKLDQAKQELAERMRRSRASDIQAEVGRMADQQIGQQYKTADESADTTGEDYGNEVQRANGFINQAQQEARKNFTPTGKDLLRASVNLGYENPDKLATVESQERAAGSKAELAQARLDFQYENMKRLADQAKDNNNVKMMLAAIRAAGGGADGGGEPAKLRQAQVYMDNVNKERKARGEEPITWEDAYNAANYSPKTSAQEKLELRRADAVKEFMKQGYEGDDLDKKVEEFMRSAMPKKDNSQKQSPTQGSKAPYPDGTRLKGKDGKMYIVKNGQPVPAE